MWWKWYTQLSQEQPEKSMKVRIFPQPLWERSLIGRGNRLKICPVSGSNPTAPTIQASEGLVCPCKIIHTLDGPGYRGMR